jgi:hypothetical protein
MNFKMKLLHFLAASLLFLASSCLCNLLPNVNDENTYCQYMKRINLNRFLSDDAKTFGFKLSRNFLNKFNHSISTNHLNMPQQNQEEIIYNYNQNSRSDTILKLENEKTTAPLSYPILDKELITLHYYFDDVETKSLFTKLTGNLFAFRVINRDYIKIRLNYESHDENRLRRLANKTIKFEFVSNVDKSSFCSLLVEFYDEDHVPVCDQLEYNVKYLNATFISYEAFKSDLTTSSGKITLDLRHILPDTLATSQRYSIVCLKCNMHLEFKLMHNLMQIKSSDQFFMENENSFENIDLLIQKELNDDYDDNFLSKNFYLNVRVYNSKRTFLAPMSSSSVDEEEKRSKRYLLHNGNDDISNSNNNNSGISIVSKTQLMPGGFSMLRPAQLVITEDSIGLQTRLKIYEHAWVDYQLNASDYVKQRIQLIAPDNPILNITQPFDYETGGADHTFQIIFTRRIDRRTSIICNVFSFLTPFYKGKENRFQNFFTNHFLNRLEDFVFIESIYSRSYLHLKMGLSQFLKAGSFSISEFLYILII